MIAFAAMLLMAPSLVLAGPKIQHWTLDNGARVYFVEAHELPLVQLRAVFDAGSSRDPKAKDGLAALTNGMLNEGAQGLTADAIASSFESVGAEFAAHADRETASVDLKSLSDKRLFDSALEVYTKLLTTPSFPAENLERERNRLLVGLARDEQSPAAIIDKRFMAELYGTHPYAHHAVGTPATVRTITREDLAAFHRRHYVGANVWFVIVGDVSAREARRLSEATVGKLPRGEVLAALPKPAVIQSTVKKVDFPATQSHIRIGQPGIARLDPDYFPLYVGNYILGGGGLVSRLSDAVREKHGYSYSVYSYFHPMRAEGPFLVGLQTKNESRDAALKLTREVIAQFVAEGPTAKELEAAKKHLTGSFPLKLDSNRKIADNLAAIAFYGLPLTYLDDWIAKVETVTAEQIRDAFKRRVQPQQMLTVIVGGGR
jgi:zinc protease